MLNYEAHFILACAVLRVLHLFFQYETVGFGAPWFNELRNANLAEFEWIR